MDELSVIEAYLTELRYSADRQPDIDDIVDEVADHLYTAVAAMVRSGVDPVDAQARVLARFGSAQLVARVFSEEAKRGGAVSTTLTRRAGVAAMLTVPLVTIGQAGNHLTDRGFVHGAFVSMEGAAFFTFCFALWGLRRRHGGLGRVGRTAFWLFVAAPFLSVPFTWMAGVAWAAQMLVVMTLLGVGMLSARVLPPLPVVLFAFTPLVALFVTPVVAMLEFDGPWLLSFFAPVGVGLVWIGWAMSREPALDVSSSGRRAAAA